MLIFKISIAKQIENLKISQLGTNKTVIDIGNRCLKKSSPNRAKVPQKVDRILIKFALNDVDPYTFHWIWYLS